MLLQIKIYLVAILYLFGAMFMLLFPPRNYGLSGSQNKRAVRNFNNTITYKEYISPEALVPLMSRLAEANSEVASLIRLPPSTAENRTILALELKSDTQTKKPGILILGALNGMAWAVPNTILQLAEKLLYDSSYQSPYFNDYDWYLIPMGNPDGINFTQSLRHLSSIDVNKWCKNETARNKTRPSHWNKNVDRDIHEANKKPCFGTHINRNFAYHWQDDVHKIPDRCSQFYAGVKPFSTAEAQAIRRYVDRLGASIQLVIYLHASYVPKKEFILYPWRYSLRQPSNYRTLQEIGEYAARQSRQPDGRLYEVHQGSSDERVAGSFSDYMCGVVGIDLVFIIKPYHQLYPAFNNFKALEEYMNKGLKTILSLVRGWRSNSKQNTLWFFGRDVEF